MSNGSGVSRGDRNRNARLERLRAAVPTRNAIVGIDLADRKQMVVVTDHDSRVLARRTFRCKAWDLGAALDWARERAARAGWSGVTIGCEPTGHRWRVLGQLAADRGMPFVCVQPMLSSWARKTEDLTCDKTDDKDAVLIARLTAQLRCYLPEPVDETGAGYATWAPDVSGCWTSTWRACSRSEMCSNASGPLPWTRRGSRSSRPPGW
ncbi:MAG: transposase [Dermatophilaceae bacterium]